MKLALTAALGALLICTAPVFGPTLAPAFAEEPAWVDIKDAVFGDQFLLSGENFIEIEAPYRASDGAGLGGLYAGAAAAQFQL